MTIPFLFTAYADGSTFFLKGISSIRILVDTFKVFSCFSGLKQNVSKCEIASLGIVKRAQEAACGLQNIDLTNDTIKIPKINFSCNRKIQTERNYLITVKKFKRLSIYGLQEHLS